MTDESQVIDLARGPGKLTAVVRQRATAPRPEEWLEAWHWDLPSVALRSRARVGWLEGQVLLTTSGVVQLETDAFTEGRYNLISNPGLSHVRRVELESESPLHLLTDGTRPAVASQVPGGTRIAISPHTSKSSELVVHIHDEVMPRFRVHHDLVTVWDLAGRVVVSDLENRLVLGNLRTRL